jgi:hypothetical protein
MIFKHLIIIIRVGNYAVILGKNRSPKPPTSPAVLSNAHREARWNVIPQLRRGLNRGYGAIRRPNNPPVKTIYTYTSRHIQHLGRELTGFMINQIKEGTFKYYFFLNENSQSCLLKCICLLITDVLLFDFFFQISRQMAQDVAGASIQRRSQSLDDEVFLLNLKPI